MRILVLGGGAQGGVISQDLAESLPDGTIWVADVQRPQLPSRANLSWLEADLGTPEAMADALEGFDLAVGALPSRLGMASMRAAIQTKTPIVDVSFSAENPLSLDSAAREAGVAVIPDCGLAPGLSHLIAGEAYARRGAPQRLMIYVGGVSQDPDRPYGYVVTWSPADLLEEYIRPARIRSEGTNGTVPVFSGVEEIEIDGVGTMIAFFSDGLRTLLDTLPDVPEMGEKTLRWPGHVEAVQPLLESGRFVEEIEEKCRFDPPKDLVVLRVVCEWPDGREQTTLVDRYDPETERTAMSRTTALTTSVVAQWVAQGGMKDAGVLPLERVAPDREAYRFIIEAMNRRGVRIATD